MDNDIYDKIADYNDWVHLERPAGGVVEMQKLQGGKMKDEIIRKKIEDIVYDKVVRTITSDQTIERLVALFESLEKENKQLQAVREAAKGLNILLLKELIIKALKDAYLPKWEYDKNINKLEGLQQALEAKGKDV